MPLFIKKGGLIMAEEKKTLSEEELDEVAGGKGLLGKFGDYLSGSVGGCE